MFDVKTFLFRYLQVLRKAGGGCESSEWIGTFWCTGSEVDRRLDWALSTGWRSFGGTRDIFCKVSQRPVSIDVQSTNLSFSDFALSMKLEMNVGAKYILLVVDMFCYEMQMYTRW